MKAAYLLLLVLPTILLILALPGRARADSISPINMKVGDTGPISDLQVQSMTIVEVGTDFLRIRVRTSEPTFDMLVRDISTTGLVDDKPWEPGSQRFKVTGTEKYKGRTMYVLKPQVPSKR